MDPPKLHRFYERNPVMAAMTTAPKNQHKIPPRPRNIHDLGVILNSKRRRNLHPMRGVGGAWIDRDRSGTYDPKLQRATPPSTPPIRVKRVRRPSRARSPARHFRRVGYNLPISFKFTSNDALAYLRSITPGPCRSRSNSRERLVSDSLSHSEDDTRRRSRRKTRKPTRLAKTTRKDGLTIKDLTSGHPQHRGCVSCFDSGIDDCSLIEHSHDYPCTACDDASVDCQLIVPPELKKICERCKYKRISCSFLKDGGKGVDVCDNCEDAGATCCAGPLKDSSYSRRYDDVLNATPPLPAGQIMPRKYVACNQCRDGTLRCNLKRDQPGPCRHCLKAGVECAFIMKPNFTRSLTPQTTSDRKHTKGLGKKLKGRPAKNKAISRAQSEELEYSPNTTTTKLSQEAYYRGAGRCRPSTLLRQGAKQSHFKKAPRKNARHQEPLYGPSSPQTPETKPGIIRILTSFAHPIHFNYIPSPDGKYPCSFCSFPFFGLAGHGPLVVEVEPSKQGFGYEEVGVGRFAGHVSKGEDYTTMCQPCTFARVKIISCPEHEMRFMEDVDPMVMDSAAWQKSIDALYHGDRVGGGLVWDARYCGLCPSIAEYRCESGCEEESKEGGGCGLMLCEACKDVLERVVDGMDDARKWETEGNEENADTTETVMDRVVKVAAGVRYDVGLRADAEFLTSKGELMVRLKEEEQKADGYDGTGLKVEDVSGDEDFEDSEGDDEGDDEGRNEDDDEDELNRERIYSQVGKGRVSWNQRSKASSAAAISTPKVTSSRIKGKNVAALSWMGEPLTTTSSAKASDMFSAATSKSKTRIAPKKETHDDVQGWMDPPHSSNTKATEDRNTVETHSYSARTSKSNTTANTTATKSEHSKRATETSPANKETARTYSYSNNICANESHQGRHGNRYNGGTHTRTETESNRGRNRNNTQLSSGFIIISNTDSDDEGV